MSQGPEVGREGEAGEAGGTWGLGGGALEEGGDLSHSTHRALPGSDGPLRPFLDLQVPSRLRNAPRSCGCGEKPGGGGCVSCFSIDQLNATERSRIWKAERGRWPI